MAVSDGPLSRGRADEHAARHAGADVQQAVVGNWTEAADSVTWDVVVPEGGWYAVEIRYACPEESAGSAYRVGMQAADELQAVVWNTGAWASLSPWLALGRLHIAAGHATVRLRAQTNVGHAVMNVAGIRLTRVAPSNR